MKQTIRPPSPVLSQGLAPKLISPRVGLILLSVRNARGWFQLADAVVSRRNSLCARSDERQINLFYYHHNVISQHKNYSSCGRCVFCLVENCVLTNNHAFRCVCKHLVFIWAKKLINNFGVSYILCIIFKNIYFDKNLALQSITTTYVIKIKFILFGHSSHKIKIITN